MAEKDTAKRESVFYLDDSVLAALDGLTEALRTLSLQTLMKDLLKCIHCIVHLLRTEERRHSLTFY